MAGTEERGEKGFGEVDTQFAAGGGGIRSFSKTDRSEEGRNFVGGGVEAGKHYSSLRRGQALTIQSEVRQPCNSLCASISLAAAIHKSHLLCIRSFIPPGCFCCLSTFSFLSAIARPLLCARQSPSLLSSAVLRPFRNYFRAAAPTLLPTRLCIKHRLCASLDLILPIILRR